MPFSPKSVFFSNWCMRVLTVYNSNKPNIFSANNEKTINWFHHQLANMLVNWIYRQDNYILPYKPYHLLRNSRSWKMPAYHTTWLPHHRSSPFCWHVLVLLLTIVGGWWLLLCSCTLTAVIVCNSLPLDFVVTATFRLTVEGTRLTNRIVCIYIDGVFYFSYFCKHIVIDL